MDIFIGFVFGLLFGYVLRFEIYSAIQMLKEKAGL